MDSRKVKRKSTALGEVAKTAIFRFCPLHLDGCPVGQWRGDDHTVLIKPFNAAGECFMLRVRCRFDLNFFIARSVKDSLTPIRRRFGLSLDP
jgi:hypothetical protein